ncbi:MAG: HK97 family phage prohead protease [Thermomicrobiales bacterium]
MMHKSETKQITTRATFKADGATGEIEAVFSTFDVVDDQGDIVLASAITDGQQVPLVWAHDWSKPVGKGTIRVEPGRAVFSGQFFLDTAAGQEAYQTVKNMGSLQEFSWGFRVLSADYKEQDDQLIRVITKTEVYEVSPVLVGANRQTYTLSLKSGLSFADQSAAVLAAVTDWSERARSLADLRQKEGRVLSEANRERIKAHADTLAGIVSDLRDLHAATAPADDGKAINVQAEYLAYQRTLARLNGVAA